jgi:hypothetical protein
MAWAVVAEKAFTKVPFTVVLSTAGCTVLLLTVPKMLLTAETVPVIPAVPLPHVIAPELTSDLATQSQVEVVTT